MTKILFKELILRALCFDNSGEHEWTHQHPQNISDRRPSPPSRIHCLKCGTFLFSYWVALHIINNTSMEIDEFPTWDGEHPAFDPDTKPLPEE